MEGRWKKSGDLLEEGKSSTEPRREREHKSERTSCPGMEAGEGVACEQSLMGP